MTFPAIAIRVGLGQRAFQAIYRVYVWGRNRDTCNARAVFVDQGRYHLLDFIHVAATPSMYVSVITESIPCTVD